MTARDTDVVISSRARLARNLAEFAFPGRQDPVSAGKVADRVREALFAGSDHMARAFRRMAIADLPPLDRSALVERRLISRDLAQDGPGREVLVSRDEHLSIMVNEEDHVRIQAITPGFSVDEAFDLALRTVRYLEENLAFAYHERFGYLTACPTNVGTGLRVSVMVHLPGHVLGGAIEPLVDSLRKLRFAVRGMYGEHSEAGGALYQVSNQATLGLSEDEIRTELRRVAASVVERERTLRRELHRVQPLALEDRVGRSLGILRNARLLTAEEALQRLSDLRLGVALGLCPDLDAGTVDDLVNRIGPASLQKARNRDLPPQERDAVRAEEIRTRLASGGAAPPMTPTAPTPADPTPPGPGTPPDPGPSAP